MARAVRFDDDALSFECSREIVDLERDVWSNFIGFDLNDG
jgi:hypothetical protein